MNKFVRTSLIAVTLGLTFAPGMTVVHAAEKAVEAPKQETIRPDMYKLIETGQIKELMAAKNYAEVKSRIEKSLAMPDVTPFELYIINNIRVNLGSTTQDNAMLLPALESMIDSGRLTPSDKLNFIEASGNIYFGMKDYDKALTWFNRYNAEANNTKQRANIIRTLYLKNDFAGTHKEITAVLAEHEKAGTVPPLETLNLLANVGAQTKNKALYMESLELRVKYYPSDAYWNELLNRTRGKDTYNMRLDLDVQRLKKATLSKQDGDDAMELAELANLGGFFSEAKAALDPAFESGALGTGPDAAKHKKARDQANKGAADDAKNADTGIASAMKSKDGVGLVNLGYVFVTMGQYDKGLDLMQKGIAKGVAKNPDDAKLHLGLAYVLAGKKAEATATLNALQGPDARTDLARYWLLWMNRPAPVAAAAAQ